MKFKSFIRMMIIFIVGTFVLFNVMEWSNTGVWFDHWLLSASMSIGLNMPGAIIIFLYAVDK